MNVRQLQRVDRWVGVPLCFMLTLVRSVAGRRADASAPLRNILCVKLAEQGSTVLAQSALRRAVELVGRENVYFIAFEDNRFILDLLGIIPEANVITISFRGLPTLFSSSVGAMRKLWRLKLDAAIDMEFFARGSAALAFLSGAKRRVGFHAFFGAGPYRGNLMTHRLLYNPHLHTSQTFQSLVEALRFDPAELPTCSLSLPATNGEPPAFQPKPGELEQVKELVQRETGGL